MVARSSSVAYGSLTCSGAPYEINDRPIVRYDRQSHIVSVSWSTVISGATQTALKDNVQTFRDALKTRYQDLTVTYAGQATHSFTHSGNTGFNSIGSCSRSDEGAGLVQVWDALVVVELPADDNTDRRMSSVNLSTDETGRKVVTISGVYTAASGGADARANYDAKADTYCDSIISGLSLTMHLVNEDSQTDDQDKVLNFTRAYKEITAEDRLKGEGTVSLSEDAAKRRTVTITGRYVDEDGAQTARDAYDADGDTYCASVLTSIASGADFDLVSENSNEDDLEGVCNFSRTYLEVIYPNAQTDLRDQTVVFTRIHEAPGDAPLTSRPERLQRIRVNYTASLDREQATDPESKYRTAIRNFMVNKAKEVFGVGSTAITNEAPSINKSGNQIQASMEMLVGSLTGGGANFVQAVLSQRHEVNNGADIRPAWDRDPYSAYVYYSPRVATRTTTAMIRMMGVQQVDNIENGPGSLLHVENGQSAGTEPMDMERPEDGWVPLSVTRNPSPLKYGIKDLGEGITVTDVGWTVVERFVRRPSAGGRTAAPVTSGGSSGGSSGGASTPQASSGDPQPSTGSGSTGRTPIAPDINPSNPWARGPGGTTWRRG